MKTAAPSSALSRAPTRYRPRMRLLPAAVAGLYVWGLTVAPLAVEAESALLTRLGAALAFLSLLLALALAPRSSSLMLGVGGFLAASVFTWWAARQTDVRTELLLFGVVGWIAYAFAWGSLSTPAPDDRTVEEGRLLSPRVRPNRWSFLLLTLAGLSIPVLLVLPSALQRPELFILVEATALCVGLFLLRAVAQLASHFQMPASSDDQEPRGVLPAALLVVSLLLAGVAWRLLL